MASSSTTSMSTTEILLEYVCPTLGLVTGNVMFFAPFYDTYVASYKVGTSLENLNPTPWIFMFGNCYGWVLYSMILQNLFIFFANVFGFIFSIWLNIQAIKLLFGQYRTTIVRQSIISAIDTIIDTTSSVQFRKSCIINSTLIDNNNNNINNINKEQTDKLIQLNLDDDDDDVDDVEIDTETGERKVQNENSNHKVTATVAPDRIRDVPGNTEQPNDSSTSIPVEENNNTNNNTNNTILDYAKIIWDVTAQNSSLQPHQHEQGFIVMCIVWIGITSIIVFGGNYLGPNTDVPVLSYTVQKLIAGYCVNLVLIFFYAAPLSTIATILRTKDTATLHIPTTMTSTFNGAFWCAYGFAVWDLFIMIPNGIGAITGCIQIILLFIFPREKKE